MPINTMLRASYEGAVNFFYWESKQLLLVDAVVELGAFGVDRFPAELTMKKRIKFLGLEGFSRVMPFDEDNLLFICRDLDGRGRDIITLNEDLSTCKARKIRTISLVYVRKR